jgi:RHS repeat-associated protein
MHTNGTEFYYIRNAQGDISGLYDDTGKVVVEYSYDTWGKPESAVDSDGITGELADTVGTKNPYRYRGYRYDFETGMYYLQSRYYSPEVGRFISADDRLNNDLLGNNTYVYCGNNPVLRADDSGHGWWIIGAAVAGGIIGGFAKIGTNLISGEKWNKGVIGAVVGGAVFGAVMAATGNVVAADLSSAAAELAVNEACSYNKVTGKWNGESGVRELNKANVKESAKKVFYDTIVNGAVYSLTGVGASRVANVGKTWIKPQKFASCFLGKYARKNAEQTMANALFNSTYDASQVYEGLLKNPDGGYSFSQVKIKDLM